MVGEEIEAKKVYSSEQAAIQDALNEIGAEMVQSKQLINETVIFYSILGENALGLFTVYKENDEYAVFREPLSMLGRVMFVSYNTKFNGEYRSVMGVLPDNVNVDKVTIVSENSEVEVNVYDNKYIVFDYKDQFRKLVY